MKECCFHSDTVKEVAQECRERANISELETQILAREGKDAAPSPGEEVHNQAAAQQLEIHVSSVSAQADLQTILSLEFMCSELVLRF